MVACKCDLYIWLTSSIHHDCLQSKHRAIIFGYDNENNVVLIKLGLDDKRFYKHPLTHSPEYNCGLLTVSFFLLLYYTLNNFLRYQNENNVIR